MTSESRFYILKVFIEVGYSEDGNCIINNEVIIADSKKLIWQVVNVYGGTPPRARLLGHSAIFIYSEWIFERIYRIKVEIGWDKR